MIDLDILDKIPDYKEYLGVDELNSNSEKLANDYPDTVKLLDLGNSSNGLEIQCLKIGEGKYNALIYGFPNPEEPVGGLLLDYFSTMLAEDKSLLNQLDYTWYLIKCIDPDGAKLCEGFLKGPHTPVNFSKNYYRTPKYKTGESCFPYLFGDININNPPPETRALMKTMDVTSFDFISSLHNWKYGGIYFRMSGRCPQLYAPLQNLTKKYNVPIEKRLQEPEYANGVTLGWFSGIHDYIKTKIAGKDPLPKLPGVFVLEYAQLMNPNVFMMVPECGIWYDSRFWDYRPSDTSLGDVHKYMVGNYRPSKKSELNKFMFDLYEKAEPFLNDKSPFLDEFNDFKESIQNPAKSVYLLPPGHENELDRPATIAEKIAMEGRADVYRLFHVGGMIRMFDYQIDQQGTGIETLESCKAEANNKLNELNDFVNEKYELKCYSIRNLIGMNLGAILYSTEYVKWRRFESFSIS